MEIKKITDEQRIKLKFPLPKEAIKPHPTKTYLSSIKAIYVVERLNDVFGVGAWKIRNEIIDNKTSHIVVKSTLYIPEYGIELEAFGGNDNGGKDSKNFDLGDAYKGASTDALTKICSFLEIGIDVFKGKADNSQPQKRTDTTPARRAEPTTAKRTDASEKAKDNRPVMNNVQLSKVLARIKDGEVELKEKCQTEFKLTPEQTKTIQEA